MEKEFLEPGTWADKRNKLKSLRDALRQGPSGVRLFLTRYRAEELPRIPNHDDMSDMSTTGYHGDWCGYFDAIETMDYFILLNNQEAKEAA